MTFKSCSSFTLAKNVCYIVWLSNKFWKVGTFQWNFSNKCTAYPLLHLLCTTFKFVCCHTLDVYRCVFVSVCVCVCVTMKPFLSYYPHRQAQKRWKAREGKCVIEKKRISFQSRTQRKSFVVHHTSLWEEGEKDRQRERGYLKRMKGKRLNGKKEQKSKHTYSKKLLWVKAMEK